MYEKALHLNGDEVCGPRLDKSATLPNQRSLKVSREGDDQAFSFAVDWNHSFKNPKTNLALTSGIEHFQKTQRPSGAWGHSRCHSWNPCMGNPCTYPKTGPLKKKDVKEVDENDFPYCMQEGPSPRIYCIRCSPTLALITPLLGRSGNKIQSLEIKLNLRGWWAV